MAGRGARGGAEPCVLASGMAAGWIKFMGRRKFMARRLLFRGRWLAHLHRSRARFQMASNYWEKQGNPDNRVMQYQTLCVFVACTASKLCNLYFGMPNIPYSITSIDYCCLTSQPRCQTQMKRLLHTLVPCLLCVTAGPPGNVTPQISPQFGDPPKCQSQGRSRQPET